MSGKETLAKWLLAPASPEQVRARQAAVVDLRSRLDLREDLAVLAEEARSLAPAEVLAAWGEGKPLLASRLLRFASAMLAGLWLVSLVAWMVWGLGYPALLVSAVNVGFNLSLSPSVWEKLSAPSKALRATWGCCAGVLARLEAEQFTAPRLVELRAALQSQGRPPSRWIARSESADGVSGFPAEHDCQIDRPLRALDVAVRLRG